MNILDLDNPGTWQEAYLPVFRAPEVERIARSDLFYNLSPCAENVEDDSVRRIRAMCIDVLTSEFTHLRAWHGCRIRDRADYITKGILRSDPETIVAQLVSCAPQMADQICAAAAYLRTRTRWQYGCVGLLPSGRCAVEHNSDYIRGSEIARRIIAHVDDKPELERRYASTGRPSLIQCRVPIEWARDCSRTGERHEAYAAFAIGPLKNYVRNKYFDLESTAAWAFDMAKDITPDLIEDIIDVPQC